MWHYPTKNDSHFCSFFVTVQFCGPPTKKSKKSSHTFGMDTRKSAAPFAFQNQSITKFYYFKKKQKTFFRLFLLLHFIFSFVKFTVRRPGLAAVCSSEPGSRWLPVSGQAEDTQLSRSAPSCCYHFYTFTLTIFSTGISVCKAVQRMTCQDQWPDYNVASVTNTDRGGKYLIIW